MKMNMLDIKTLSKENLNKIHAVLKTIDTALEIGKIENGTLLIPKENFEQQHVHISEVESVLAKIAKEENDLIVVVPHENPHPPDKRFELPPSAGDSSFREPFEHKQANYERERQKYEETYSKNIELRIKDSDKFNKLLEAVEKVGGNQGKVKQNSIPIEKITCVESAHGGNKFLMIINDDYEHSFTGDMVKPSWDTLFKLATGGQISYDPLKNKGSLDYLSSNTRNKLYTKTPYAMTKILKVEDGFLVPNIKLNTISEKAYQTRINKTKSA